MTGDGPFLKSLLICIVQDVSVSDGFGKPVIEYYRPKRSWQCFSGLTSHKVTRNCTTSTEVVDSNGRKRPVRMLFTVQEQSAHPLHHILLCPAIGRYTYNLWEYQKPFCWRWKCAQCSNVCLITEVIDLSVQSVVHSSA